MLIIAQIVTRVLLDKSNYTDSVTASPYFAGIISASMVWVAYAWISRLVHREYQLPCRLFRLLTRIQKLSRTHLPTSPSH